MRRGAAPSPSAAAAGASRAASVRDADAAARWRSRVHADVACAASAGSLPAGRGVTPPAAARLRLVVRPATIFRLIFRARRRARPRSARSPASPRAAGARLPATEANAAGDPIGPPRAAVPAQLQDVRLSQRDQEHRCHQHDGGADLAEHTHSDRRPPRPPPIRATTTTSRVTGDTAKNALSNTTPHETLDAPRAGRARRAPRASRDPHPGQQRPGPTTPGRFQISARPGTRGRIRRARYDSTRGRPARRGRTASRTGDALPRPTATNTATASSVMVRNKRARSVTITVHSCGVGFPAPATGLRPERAASGFSVPLETLQEPRAQVPAAGSGVPSELPSENRWCSRCRRRRIPPARAACARSPRRASSPWQMILAIIES